MGEILFSARAKMRRNQPVEIANLSFTAFSLLFESTNIRSDSILIRIFEGCNEDKWLFCRIISEPRPPPMNPRGTIKTLFNSIVDKIHF